VSDHKNANSPGCERASTDQDLGGFICEDGVRQCTCRSSVRPTLAYQARAGRAERTEIRVCFEPLANFKRLSSPIELIRFPGRAKRPTSPPAATRCWPAAQSAITAICGWRRERRLRSLGSPVAMSAISNSSAVETTKASTAFAEDIRALASKEPARWAICLVNSTTLTASLFKKWLTAASNRPPRQTSARTGEGTRTSAPRSWAILAIARARSASAPRAVGFASAFSASESRINASAKRASHGVGLVREQGRGSRRARQEIGRAPRVPILGPQLVPRMTTSHGGLPVFERQPPVYAAC